MSTPVEVVVKTMPATDEFTFFLNIISVAATVIGAIGIPIALYIFSRKFSREGEQRADKQAADLRASDEKRIFLENTHRAIDDLYKKVHVLFHNIHIQELENKTYNNAKEAINKITDKQLDLCDKESNRKNSYHENNYRDNKSILNAMADKAVDSISYLNENRGVEYIEVNLSRMKLARVVGSDNILSIDKLVLDIIKSSKDNNNITFEKISEFDKEIDRLTDEVESTLDKWLNLKK